MTEDDPIGLAVREALWLTLQVGGPPLLAMLAVGLLSPCCRR
jgi:flagellar biosynthesis protein FliQ